MNKKTYPYRKSVIQSLFADWGFPGRREAFTPTDHPSESRILLDARIAAPKNPTVVGLFRR